MVNHPSSCTLPLVLIQEVFHVGSFDASDKGEQGASLEGNGLSISLHPEEWTAIARLGGRPTWKMTAGAGHGRFLDAHALSSEQNLFIAQWGLEHGWVNEVERWKASWIEDEGGSDGPSRSWSLYHSPVEAASETEDLEDVEIKSVVVHVSSSKMRERCGFDPGDMNAVDILRTFYAEDHALDGVWWNDTLDRWALSAPRGVINRTSLDSWSKDCVADAKPRGRSFRP